MLAVCHSATGAGGHPGTERKAEGAQKGSSWLGGAHCDCEDGLSRGVTACELDETGAGRFGVARGPSACGYTHTKPWTTHLAQLGWAWSQRTLDREHSAQAFRRLEGRNRHRSR